MPGTHSTYRRSAIAIASFLIAALALPVTSARAQDEGGGDFGGADFGGDTAGESAGDSELDAEPLEAELEEEEPEPEEPPEPSEREIRERDEDELHPDDVRWALNAGGSLSYGNSHSGTINAATAFNARRGDDVFALEASFYYAIAATPRTCASTDPSVADYCAGLSSSTRAPGFNPWTELSVSLSWRLRYDHFFDAANALFLAHRGRIDRFSGLSPRVSLQLGYSRMVFEEAKHHLAIDLGVDATFDWFTSPVVQQNQRILARGDDLPIYTWEDRRFVPSLRFGAAYVNHLNDFLTYDTSFEALWNVASILNAANPGTHFRFEWVNHVRTQIDRTFHIQLDVTMRLDALPPTQLVAWQEQQNAQLTTMFEIFTTLNVGGSFDLDGEPPRRSE